MNILFFSDIFPDADHPSRGTYNYELCKALAADHSVRIIAPRGWTEAIPFRWSGARYRPRADHDGRELPTSFPTYWYTPKVLRQHYGSFLWRSVRRTVQKMNRSFSPDAVLSYWAHPDGEAGLRVARQRGVPAAVIVGGSDVLLLPQCPKRGARVRRVLQQSDAVITISEGLRDAVIDLGVDAGRVHTIRQGINPKLFFSGDRSTIRAQLAASQPPLAGVRPLLLWVGRMVPVKRLDWLLAGAEELRRRGRDFILCLAGDGPLRREMEQLTADLGLASCVHFAGSLAPESIGDWYRAADVTVLSSESEGLPNVLRESLACGTPIVSTDVGSVKEIADRRTSVLTPPGDAAALADAIERVLDGPYQTSARESLTRTWSDMAADVARLLEDCRVQRSTWPTSQTIAHQPRKTSTARRALFVSYLFPPVGGVGVIRVAKFIKHLPRYNWRSSVLTVKNPSVPLFDESLLGDVPPGTMVCKARTIEPGYAFKSTVASDVASPALMSRIKSGMKGMLKRLANAALLPDAQILWYPFAVRAGLRLLRDVPHDVIVASGPPFTNLLVGAALSRRTGLPLVLDYRDEWDISNSYWENKRPGRVAHWIQQQMQRSAIRAAAALVATTPSSAKSLGQLVARCGRNVPSLPIYNGFDPADYPQASTPRQKFDYGNGTDRFRISFTGTLWELTSLEPFVHGIERLVQRSPALAERLEVVFAGRWAGRQDDWLHRLERLPCHVVRLGYLEHSQAIQLMMTSDALLLLLSDVPHADRVISSKVFEYMGARRPIFAISPAGDQTDVLRTHPASVICSPRDPDGIAEALAVLLEEHRCGVHRTIEDGDAGRFERSAQAEQLAALLDTLASVRHRDAAPELGVTPNDCSERGVGHSIITPSLTRFH
ncbi:MAG: glycosyltransferase [Planctomycetaceae bacterium]|nr:glycosyltransferase [Planctomycetaceae bacterium]